MCLNPVQVVSPGATIASIVSPSCLLCPRSLIKHTALSVPIFASLLSTALLSSLSKANPYHTVIFSTERDDSRSRKDRDSLLQSRTASCMYIVLRAELITQAQKSKQQQFVIYNNRRGRHSTWNPLYKTKNL
jgi:hypothetical protein